MGGAASRSPDAAETAFGAAVAVVGGGNRSWDDPLRSQRGQAFDCLGESRLLRNNIGVESSLPKR